MRTYGIIRTQLDPFEILVASIIRLSDLFKCAGEIVVCIWMIWFEV